MDIVADVDADDACVTTEETLVANKEEDSDVIIVVEDSLFEVVNELNDEDSSVEVDVKVVLKVEVYSLLETAVVDILLNVSLKYPVFDTSDEISCGGVIVDSETWLEQTLVKVLVIVIKDTLAGVLGHVTVETIVYSLVVVVKDVPPVQMSHGKVETLVV